MSKFIPDRKFLASGISGVLAFLIVTFIDGIDEKTAMSIVGGVMAAVHYFVPPSVKDIVKRVDDTIIGLAGKTDA